ncbi:putative cell wall protein [Iris pallida]|uniref:Cell wall protein n=1 Tax=Iris pallida TaxID=29817 RepID=A0AAX6I0W4_IRIPA|nr:putative cell wall protein [Iris pallida]
MAAFASKSGAGLSLALCLLVVVSLAPQATMVRGRKAPAAAAPDRKQTDCLDTAEGTVLIPGVGRTAIGGGHKLPSIGGLDNSGPAAANGQYIPGADDTFVPNPGFEVPNPFRGSVNP